MDYPNTIIGILIKSKVLSTISEAKKCKGKKCKIHSQLIVYKELYCQLPRAATLVHINFIVDKLEKNYS